MENPAYTHLFNDILGKVLELSENPSQFGEYLTQQIRELIGARIIVIAVQTENGQAKIFSVYPQRRKEWANQDAVLKLAEFSFDFETIQNLDKEKSEANTALLLQELEIDKVIAIPLIAANRKVGSILLLDIMDRSGIESIIELLTRLAGVFALVIRNSSLYQNMENLVAVRTLELQQQNNKLIKREQELQLANEEYEVLNEELAENEQLYRKMNENSPLGMHFYRLSIDNQLIFVAANPAADKILGVDNSQFIGKTIEEAFPPLMHTEVPERYRNAAEKGILWTTEQIVYDDKKISGAFEVKVFQTTPGNMVAVFSDITKRKLADQVQQVLYAISMAALSSADLIELNEIIRIQLGKLLDTTNFYIATYDDITGMLFSCFEKDEKDRIESWPAGKTATGYVIRHQQSLLATDKDFLKLVEAGEIEMLGEPSKVWLGVPLWAENKVIGAVVVQHYDNPNAYTEKDKLTLEIISNQISMAIIRKKAEGDLISAMEKAEQSDRLKSAFLANMSHEIRTPMNGILGFTALLKEPGLTGDEKEKYINIIEKSGARLLNIINDIVDISKIEAGQMEVAISDTNVNEQIEFIYNFFRKEVEKKGMQISYNNSLSSQKALIKTDREKILAILTNLVGNAIKYSRSDSIELGYERKGKHLEFYVKDFGVGIHHEKQEIIFERFRQGGDLTNQFNEGTGLGLSISRAYVEMLGGRMWVESEVGRGSAFYFTIPYNPVMEEAESENVVSTDRENIHVKNLKILIAEDDENSEILIKTTLKILMKEYFMARTGAEAVEVCRNNPDLDLVLMDIRMPVFDGYEATRQIRQFNKDVIIIAQTAYAQSGDKEKALEAGCTDYISKPIKRETLLALIHKHLS